MSERILPKVFEQLVYNRDFPNSQLERRLDIFINIFLEEILTNYLGKLVTYVCPEFPIKNKENNLSTKLDYLCTSNTEIIFIELKTSKSSLKLSQAEIYLDSNWINCLSDLEEIMMAVKNKNHKASYAHLNSIINKKIISSSKNLDLKVIYISPLPLENSKFSNELNIINSKKISELLPIFKDDKLLAPLFEKIDLYVFEIEKKS